MEDNFADIDKNVLSIKGSISPIKVADFLCSCFETLHCNGTFYQYRDGCYKPIKPSVIRRMARKLFAEEVTCHKLNETIGAIRDTVDVETDDLNRTDYLNVKNGMIDLKTMKLEAHDPKYYSTVQINAYFDNNARCPMWHKVLKEIFEGNEVKIRLFQEFFGLCFTKVTKFHKALFCIGDGDNGKSTLIEILQAIVGDKNYSAVTLEHFGNPHYLANLHGKLFNISSETNAKTTMYDSTFKAIVSGDVISADNKFKDPFEFHPFCKLIFNLNNMPRVEDKTNAYFRRLLILRFNRTFIKGVKNREIKEGLLRERNGIFMWGLQGYQNLCKRDDFEEDDSIIAEVKEYRKENNNVLAFIDEKCKIGPGLTIAKKALYSQYNTWCSESNLHALSVIKFGKELKKRNDVIEERQADVRYWHGIDSLP